MENLNMDMDDKVFEVFDEYTLAEIEVVGGTLLQPGDLENGATILISNDGDGTIERILSHDELVKLFQPMNINTMQIPTEVAVERTLADPELKQILETVNKEDFDPKVEQMKIREFLAGVTNIKPAPVDVPVLPDPEPQSTDSRIIKCANCSNFFDILSFENHTCEYDANQKLIELPERNTNPALKLSSERIIMENQIRIKRFIKDELKYDIGTGNELTDAKKTKGPNECNLCERKFVHASGLLRHMEKHTMDLIPTQFDGLSTNSNSTNASVTHGLRVVLKCVICGCIFYTTESALDHINVHFQEEPKLKLLSNNIKQLEDDLDAKVQVGKGLIEAIEKFGNDMEERNSEEISTTKNKFFATVILSSVLQCEFCDLIFADVSYLLSHSSTHVPEYRFECTLCEVHMLTSKEASFHHQSECAFTREAIKHHGVTLNRYFVCNVCELKFNNTELLLDHRYSSNHYFPRLSKTRDRLVMACDFCDMFFESAVEVQPHYEEKHMNKKKRDKELRNANVNGSGRLRQYLCDICGKSYTQSSHLWQHLRFHQGVKPFVCTEKGCGRKFTIRPDLNDHIRKCHTGERPYHCLVCGKRFLTGSVFYQHRLIHRGERRYECDECGKRFYRADALKNHQRIHTGEKPYSCLFCTKTFRQRGDRDKHIRARHSHLDANSRLMMQMQKFQLESAAAAAAEKAKMLAQQPNGIDTTSDAFLKGDVAGAYPIMTAQPQGEFYALPIIDNDQQFFVYEEQPEILPSMPQTGIFEPIEKEQDNIIQPEMENEPKVVVVGNTAGPNSFFMN